MVVHARARVGCDTLHEPAGAVFHPGDCTHPDWPGLHICCGRSGEMPGSNCERPELVDHPCSTEGQTQDLKAFRVCCKGLTPISTATSNDITTTDAGSCNVEFALDPTILRALRRWPLRSRREPVQLRVGLRACTNSLSARCDLVSVRAQLDPYQTGLERRGHSARARAPGSVRRYDAACARTSRTMCVR